MSVVLTAANGARCEPLKVFLTGASSGIGLALARSYAAQGATLGLVARRSEVLVHLFEEIALQFPAAEVLVLPADVREAFALRQAARRFIERFGCPDIVIANAGVSTGTLTGCDELSVFEVVMATNYLGMVATFEPFVALMRRQRRGTLVGVGSVAGVRGLPGHGAYSASKAAAMNYLESLRIELRGSGIRVVTLAPGYIRTPMTAKNNFPMPFLMEPAAFAAKVIVAIRQGRSYCVFPYPMRILSALLHLLPRILYDAIMHRMPRKPH